MGRTEGSLTRLRWVGNRAKEHGERRGAGMPEDRSLLKNQYPQQLWGRQVSTTDKPIPTGIGQNEKDDSGITLQTLQKRSHWGVHNVLRTFTAALFLRVKGYQETSSAWHIIALGRKKSTWRNLHDTPQRKKYKLQVHFYSLLPFMKNKTT